MKEITELVERIETEISKTPTGELRNLLCDANICLRTLHSVVESKDCCNKCKELLYEPYAIQNNQKLCLKCAGLKK